jgi:hypothetical protein
MKRLHLLPVSDQKTISLYSQVEETADLLISQLLRIKERVQQLRQLTDTRDDKDEQVLSDKEVAALLNKRHRTISKQVSK